MAAQLVSGVEGCRQAAGGALGDAGEGDDVVGRLGALRGNELVQLEVDLGTAMQLGARVDGAGNVEGRLGAARGPVEFLGRAVAAGRVGPGGGGGLWGGRGGSGRLDVERGGRRGRRRLAAQDRAQQRQRVVQKRSICGGGGRRGRVVVAVAVGVAVFGGIGEHVEQQHGWFRLPRRW